MNTGKNRMNLLASASLSILMMASLEAQAKDIFVAKTGSDENSGSVDAPLLTINKAAQIAGPGDVVTVREGVYREWVRPARGGASDDERIVYQAAPGEDVKILGSRPVTNWTKDGDLWLATISIDFFPSINPFAELIRHPIYVEVDESGDGWGWLKYGRNAHRGDVIVNGEGLTERHSKEDMSKPLSWYAEVDEDVTRLWANFGDLNPNKAEVEISVLPYLFYPDKSGLSYITVRGFSMMNVATHWAPPTVHQPGAIGPNGGHNWIIENNTVAYSKGLCISLGLPTDKIKLTKKKSGQHVVRNNVLLRCGQGGVAGQDWIDGSRIEGNYIKDTNYRIQYGGWETAGIKFHNADHLLIEGNFVDGVSTIDREIGAAHGVWIDYQNRNVRVTRNIIRDSGSDAILSEANWKGPLLYDNNIIIGGRLATASSRGEMWAHNLFIDTPPRWENQDWGNRVPVKNARWFNNIFVGKGLSEAPDEPTYEYGANAYFNGAAPSAAETDGFVSADEVDYRLEETEAGMMLYLTAPFENLPAPADDLANRVKPNFKIKGPVDDDLMADFLSESRAETSQIGPFARPFDREEGRLIWAYDDQYKKALKLIGQ